VRYVGKCTACVGITIPGKAQYIEKKAQERYKNIGPTYDL